MQITVELPADIACHPNAGREALEALVIEGDFLGRHVALYDYSIEELEAEADLLHRLPRKA